MSHYTQNPFDRTGAARLVAGRFLENVLLVTEKQATSIAIGWSDPVSGREVIRPSALLWCTISTVIDILLPPEENAAVI
jgi:hypothetical protein